MALCDMQHELIRYDTVPSDVLWHCDNREVWFATVATYYSITWYDVVWYDVIVCNATRHASVLRYSTTWYNIPWTSNSNDVHMIRILQISHVSPNVFALCATVFEHSWYWYHIMIFTGPVCINIERRAARQRQEEQDEFKSAMSMNLESRPRPSPLQREWVCLPFPSTL